MTKKDIEKLIIDYGNFRDKVETFEELIPYENTLINKLNEAINDARCSTQLLCIKSDGLLDITRGEKYVMIEEDETSYKLKNDIGVIRYYNKNLLKKSIE